ncbi:hypothetical protein [Phytomonospora endophytica]|uniref:Mce-associated membrane protein n=1 Tax=Phytomonospora endophytica TaxID=714109 RepID=A0A841FRG9_9ACTN|nr:hypothetical protein [Phytomonospora endophytica]MBB6037413.1 Mce-associated membrane protein [Phytomonospora endophytica]GIG69844.1 hypothetical protein Pen01_61390 [Phytomonospora endophytica]
MSGKYVPRSLREKNRKPRPSGAATGSADSSGSAKKPGEATDGSVKTAPKPSPRPRPTPGTRPAPRTRGAVRPLRRHRSVAQLRRLALRLSATAVLIMLIAGATFYFLQRADGLDKAAAEAEADARVAVQAIVAYDYRSFDSSKANGMAHVTGAFAEDYGKQMDGLRDQVIKEKAVVVAPVSGSGIVSVETDGLFSFTPKSVDVLLFVNQIRRNDNINGEKVDTNRIVLHMVQDGGEWKAASVTAY